MIISGLNGAMSNFGIRNGSGSPPSETDAGSNVDDIHGFILEEMSRRCMADNARKRTSATSDANMDSPTRKRSRLL